MITLPRLFHLLVWRVVIVAILLLATAMMLASRAAAQGADLLPVGIGAIQMGYRGFAPQTHTYNAAGKRELLGAPLSSQFNGQNLLEGKGGADLQRLARELQKFDSYSQSSDSLINKLDLGKMEGDVRANISAKFFGVAYGLSRRINLFFAAPWVEAEVNTELNFAGLNNAQQIKKDLGAVAFDELKVGLDRASAINTAQIKQSIESFGYAPLDHWEYKGFGDLMLGTNFGEQIRVNRYTNYHYMLTTTATLPTGYTDDPDVLTDVGIGTGYYGIENKFTPRLELFQRMSFGGWVAYKYNFPTLVDRRVPEAEEALVDSSRKFQVDYTPGADYSVGIDTRFRYGTLIGAYRLGYKEHAKDVYDGPIEGNYELLAAASHMRQAYHEVAAGFDTAKAYQRKKFPVPMIINASAHLPIKAYNSQDERYYELSFTTFFATPAAKIDSEKSQRQQAAAKKKSKKSLRQIAH